MSANWERKCLGSCSLPLRSLFGGVETTSDLIDPIFLTKDTTLTGRKVGRKTDRPIVKHIRTGSMVPCKNAKGPSLVITQTELTQSASVSRLVGRRREFGLTWRSILRVSKPDIDHLACLERLDDVGVGWITSTRKRFAYTPTTPVVQGGISAIVVYVSAIF